MAPPGPIADGLRRWTEAISSAHGGDADAHVSGFVAWERFVILCRRARLAAVGMLERPGGLHARIQGTLRGTEAGATSEPVQQEGGIVGTVRRLIERLGFLLVLVAIAATAAGAVWGVRALWIGGLLGLGIAAATVAVRATRDAFGQTTAGRRVAKPDKAMRADDV